MEETAITKREKWILSIVMALVMVSALMVIKGPGLTSEARAQQITKKLTTSAKAVSSGEIWYTANQGTFAWDAVTQTIDGSNLPAGNVVKYQVWRRAYSISAVEKVGDIISATQATVSFPEGTFLVGVNALRYSAENELITETEVSWSDNPAVCKDGQTFGFKHYLALVMPAGLRPVK